MNKVRMNKVLAGVVSLLLVLTWLPAVTVLADDDSNKVNHYLENFTYPDEMDNNDNFLPSDWEFKGVMPGLTAIRYDEELDNYYYEINREEYSGSSYIGNIFDGELPNQYTLSMNLKYTDNAGVNLFMYEDRLNSGNLAVRVGIKQDNAGGSLYAYDGSTETSLVSDIEDLGWVKLSYAINNIDHTYIVMLDDMDGNSVYKSDEFSFNSDAAEKAGAFSINCSAEAHICFDDIRLDSFETLESGGEETGGEETGDDGSDEGGTGENIEYEIIDFYFEDFNYPNEVDNNGYLPADWASVSSLPDLRAIRYNNDNYYYEVGRAADSTGGSYIGKLFQMTLPDQYSLSMDLNYTNSANVNLFMYENALNTGNLAVRVGIEKNDNGGSLFAYDGSTKKTLVTDIESLSWFNLSYVIDNTAKTYQVIVKDSDGEIKFASDVMAFNNNAASGAGAISVNCSAGANISLDNFRLSGEDKPYAPTPVEPLPDKTGKVYLVDNGTTYTMGNDYTKVVIEVDTAKVTSMIRYISGGGIEEGGYNVLGKGGYGYYLLNYVLNGIKGESSIKGATVTEVVDEDDFCELVITFDNVAASPVALELHFVLEDDTEGVYMYSYSRRATGVAKDATVSIEQSRYSFRLDSRLYPYSCVEDGVMVHFPDVEEYTGEEVFDATYLLEDGTLYTKYNNCTYQHNSIVLGAYGEEFGFSLVTPSRDWAGGGYTKQDIDVHDTTSSTRIVNWHFATAHNGTSWAEVADDWEKLYGPVLWYSNANESKEDIWEDAVTKAAEETQNWPYSWVDDEDYAAENRSTVKGNFSVTNGEIVDVTTDISPAGTFGWAVLSDISSEYWTKDNSFYEYYAPIQADGSFEIDNVRSGAYKININVNGVIGEYEQRDIQVGQNTVVELGNIVWDNPVYGETLWTIGIPDRTAEEYNMALPYRYWGSHLLFNELFPDGVNFKIGESKESEDWFFSHMASQTTGELTHYDGSFYWDEETQSVKYDASRGESITVDDERWRGDEAALYNIIFDSDVTYVEGGNATLLVAISGSREGTLMVRVNGEAVLAEAISVSGGGGMPRSSIVDQYSLIAIEFDAVLLNQSENVITLSHAAPAYAEGATTASGKSAYKAIIYDAIRLDIDADVAD